MLVDTHAHLTSRRFQGHLDDILARSRAEGVKHIVTIGCDLDDSEQVVGLIEAHEMVSGAIGVHPCYVHEVTEPDWIDRLKKLAQSHPVAAIGEIGLDYYHAPPEGFTEESWRARQAEYFEAQLQLSVELALPVVIHQRESGDDVLAILKNFPKSLAVLHCFTGTQAQAELALELGHYLSFTGVVTYPKAPDVRELAAFVPEDRFMVETDSPYLAPVPFRGKSNEPAYVVHTARQIAEVRGIEPEECASLTTQNAARFFKEMPF